MSRQKSDADFEYEIKELKSRVKELEYNLERKNRE